jgi:arylsulfatase
MPRPNILLIMCDQLRYDAIAAHGNPAIDTPNLDRLATSGVSFRRAYTESPVCVPARGIALTGRLPHRTGVVDNQRQLAPDTPTFATELARGGYVTQAIGKMHFRPVREPYGFQRLWLSEEIPQLVEDDDYLTAVIAAGHGHLLEPHGVRHELYYVPQPSQLPENLTTTAWTGQRTIDFLREHASRNSEPFLCWTSFIKPHPPFDPPAPWYLRYDPLQMPDPVRSPAERERLLHHVRQQHRAKWTSPDFEINRIRTIRAYYYALVSFVDHWVGRIIDALEDLGLRDNTLLVFTADHGEYLGDHWAFGKRGFHDAAARLPFVASWPDRLPQGRSVNALIGLEDLAPTLLAAAGIDTAALAADGIDLLPLASGEIDHGHDHLIGQFQQAATGLYLSMDRDFKYIYSAADHRELLLRVGSQTDETVDLATDPNYEDVLSDLRNRVIRRFQEDDYLMPLDGHGWREFPPSVDIGEPDDRLSDGRGRQYPLWPKGRKHPPGLVVDTLNAQDAAPRERKPGD